MRWRTTSRSLPRLRRKMNSGIRGPLLTRWLDTNNLIALNAHLGGSSATWTSRTAKQHRIDHVVGPRYWSTVRGSQCRVADAVHLTWSEKRITSLSVQRSLLRPSMLESHGDEAIKNLPLDKEFDVSLTSDPERVANRCGMMVHLERSLGQGGCSACGPSSRGCCD